MTGDLDERASAHWWLFLITGTLWLVFAIVVFRFNIQTVTAIGWVIGGICWAAALNELLAMWAARGGWKALRAALAALFFLIGLFAVAYPERTFTEVAAIFSFFLLFKGMFDIMAAFATRAVADLWWTGLIVGTVEILLAFWAAGNFGREAVLLVVWAGAAAIARGALELSLAFRLRGLGGGPPRAAPA